MHDSRRPEWIAATGWGVLGAITGRLSPFNGRGENEAAPARGAGLIPEYEAIYETAVGQTADYRCLPLNYLDPAIADLGHFGRAPIDRSYMHHLHV